ncbi:MAG: flagellar biosynthetic protein FliR [Candidatus Anstonellales archaeon]
MNISDIFTIIITSLFFGVRFIPVISISDLFGGKFTPLIVRSSLIALLGFFRYFVANGEELNSTFGIFFILKEFLWGFIISSPFIILLKSIINSTSLVENLFGNVGSLNAQGVFDERSSPFETIFEMIVILLIFSTDTHLFLLNVLLNSYDPFIGGDIIKQITLDILKYFNMISKNGIWYFAPVIFVALSSTVILAFADLLGNHFNMSSHNFLLNTIIILIGFILLFNKVCSYLLLDINRIRYLSNLFMSIAN